MDSVELFRSSFGKFGKNNLTHEYKQPINVLDWECEIAESAELINGNSKKESKKENL